MINSVQVIDCSDCNGVGVIFYGDNEDYAVEPCGCTEPQQAINTKSKSVSIYGRTIFFDHFLFIYVSYIWTKYSDFGGTGFYKNIQNCAIMDP